MWHFFQHLLWECLTCIVGGICNFCLLCSLSSSCDVLHNFFAVTIAFWAWFTSELQNLCHLWYTDVWCIMLLDLPGGIWSKRDGLSVNRLTLLGRVHMARVVVDSLNLEGASAVDTVPVRDRRQRGPRGKPPTPVRTADRNKRRGFLYCC